VTHAFNAQAFLKKRSRSTNQPPDPMVMSFSTILYQLDILGVRNLFLISVPIFSIG
jgi:hypothetical protein